MPGISAPQTIGQVIMYAVGSAVMRFGLILVIGGAVMGFLPLSLLAKHPLAYPAALLIVFGAAAIAAGTTLPRKPRRPRSSPWWSFD